MKSAEEKRNKLVSIIDKLFVFGVHPQTQKKEIMINPKLTMKSVDKLSIETREYIKELYAECERILLKVLTYLRLSYTQMHKPHKQNENSREKETNL